MKALKYLLTKEFLQIFRDKTILKLIFLMPMVQLLVLPWAATFEQKNIQLAILDKDQSSYSRELSQKILASGYFQLAGASVSYSQALQQVERNEADLILEIPHNFEKELVMMQHGSLMLSLNAVNGQKAGLGASYIGQIVADFSQQVRISNMVHNPQASALVGGVSLQPYFKYNPRMQYSDFMVPGILVMLVTLISGILSALNIVKEKEIGTIEQINVTPISRTVFILGKLIPFWIIGMVVLTIGIAVAWLMYGLWPHGGLHTIYVFALVYMIAFTGLGLVMSSYSDTQQQATFLAFFFFMIFFLLGGLFTPISSMPQWAQVVTRFNPVRYFIEVIRLVYMKGAGFSYILPQLAHIVLFAIVFNVWAVVSYKKRS